MSSARAEVSASVRVMTNRAARGRVRIIRAGLDAFFERGGADVLHVTVGEEVVGVAGGAVGRAAAEGIGPDFAAHAAPRSHHAGVDVVRAGGGLVGVAEEHDDGARRVGDADEAVEDGFAGDEFAGRAVVKGVGLDAFVHEVAGGVAGAEFLGGVRVGGADADGRVVGAEVGLELFDPGGIGIDAVDAGEAAVVLGGVEVDAGADGLHVGGAFRALAGFHSPPDCRHGQGGEDRDDRDDHQQLDQSKSTLRISRISKRSTHFPPSGQKSGNEGSHGACF